MEARTKPRITGINAFTPRNLLTSFRTEGSNLKRAFQSKENFKQYLRAPGSEADPTGSYSWINDGMTLKTILV